MGRTWRLFDHDVGQGICSSENIKFNQIVIIIIDSTECDDLPRPRLNLRANEPHVFELTGLDPDAGYSYRLRFRNQGNGEFLDSAPGDFRTRRAGGSAFAFAVQADSHMGAMTRHQKWCPTCGRELADDVTYANTMINLVKYNPDFLVDLGDTFMTSQNFGNGLFAIQNRQRGAPIREIDVVGDFLLLRQYLGQDAGP